MKSRTQKTLAFALMAAGATLASVSAQADTGYADAPPGWIDDLGGGSAAGTPTPSSYTLFTTTFVAAGPETTLNFAFRETPAYFSFDDVSLQDTTAGTAVTLADPGFELSASAVTTNFPGNGWGRWIQPEDTDAIGEVATNSQPYSCSGAHTGSVFWCDGSVQGYDGLYQTVATTTGHSYQISFYLADNSGENWIPTGNGSDPSPDEIDALVYAENGVNVTPLGTTTIGTTPSVPEPATLALLGFGLAGLGFGRRRASKTSA